MGSSAHRGPHGTRTAESSPNGRAVLPDLLDRPEPEMLAVLREKTVAERLEIADGMWRFAEKTIRAQLESAQPEATAAELDRQTARRLAHGSW